jgi:hypothetical protein
MVPSLLSWDSALASGPSQATDEALNIRKIFPVLPHAECGIVAQSAPSFRGRDFGRATLQHTY